MPTFYEGEPIVRASQTLTEQEYCRAVLVRKTMTTPFSGRGVKAAACLTGAALAASCVPAYLQWEATFFLPLAGTLLLLALAGYFCFVEPDSIRSAAARRYQSNRLMQLPAELTLYRDSMEYKSEAETMNAYWTDFAACYESTASFIFVGGIDRDPLVLMKEGLPKETVARLETHLQETFTARYRKVKK